MERVGQTGLPCLGQKDHRPREPGSPGPTSIPEQGAIWVREGWPSWEGQPLFQFILYWWLNSALQHHLGQGISLRYQGGLNRQQISQEPWKKLGKPWEAQGNPSSWHPSRILLIPQGEPITPGTTERAREDSTTWEQSLSLIFSSHLRTFVAECYWKLTGYELGTSVPLRIQDFALFKYFINCIKSGWGIKAKCNFPAVFSPLISIIPRHLWTFT